MNTNRPPATPPDGSMTGQLTTASMLSGATLLVAAIIAALGIYFYNWSGFALLVVFFLGYVAYLIGARIDRQKGIQ